MTGSIALKNVAVLSVFTVASALLGILKFPSPVGSIALDSAPAYFVAGFFGWPLGGIVGVFGHLASALTAGFPLGWLHGVIAGQMFVCCGLFGFITRSIDRTWALVPAGAAAILLNGVAAPWSLGAAGFLPQAVANGLIAILVLSSLANVSSAAVSIALLAKRDIPGI